jgi:dsRNA-specific ribonuclease
VVFLDERVVKHQALFRVVVILTANQLVRTHRSPDGIRNFFIAQFGGCEQRNVSGGGERNRSRIRSRYVVSAFRRTLYQRIGVARMSRNNIYFFENFVEMAFPAVSRAHGSQNPGIRRQLRRTIQEFVFQSFGSVAYTSHPDAFPCHTTSNGEVGNNLLGQRAEIIGRGLPYMDCEELHERNVREFLAKPPFGYRNIPSGQIGLFASAFVHDSYSNESGAISNERLEFLGDAVLELAACRYVYSLTDYGEGKMTDFKQSIVCNRRISESLISYGLDIDGIMMVGNGHRD